MKEKTKRLVFSFLLILAGSAFGQDAMHEFGSNAGKMHDLLLTTPAYRSAALRLIVGEANRVAEELHLQDTLPITETNLVSCYIPPPRMAQRLSAIGNLTTSNYTYFFSVGNKFSFLTKTGLQKDYPKLQRDYLWPMSRMDTNAAYQLAVKWLSEASMDVSALNKDCKVHILAFTPEGDGGKYFVPVYWVYWSKPEQEGHGSTASVELFEPTKTIRQLRVEDSKYILRQSLQITNLDFLLSQTNASMGRPTRPNLSNPINPTQ
jgi:hypothetical protein